MQHPPFLHPKLALDMLDKVVKVPQIRLVRTNIGSEVRGIELKPFEWAGNGSAKSGG
jgi:hypothetical protein